MSKFPTICHLLLKINRDVKTCAFHDSVTSLKDSITSKISLSFLHFFEKNEEEKKLNTLIFTHLHQRRFRRIYISTFRLLVGQDDFRVFRKTKMSSKEFKMPLLSTFSQRRALCFGQI